jgi:ferritin-like metal-binding protein YciE
VVPVIVFAEIENQALKDSAVGVAATKAEHYEIAAYKDLIDSAQMMGKAKSCLSP